MTAPVDGDRVLLRDVGPRDGLQAIDQDVSLDTKIAMTNGLVAAGIRRVEAGSFVSPNAVPRMADSRQVFDAMPTTGVSREALVVNERGAHAAVAANVDVLVGVISASDTFSHRNVRMSTADAIDELAAITEVARDGDLPVSVDLSAAFGCAFEGTVAVERVADVAEQIAAAGAFEIVLADTIGSAAPNDIATVVAAVRARVGPTSSSASICTTPAASPSRTRPPGSTRASAGSTRASAGSAAVRSPRAPPATSAPRISCTCSTRSGCPPASISTN